MAVLWFSVRSCLGQMWSVSSVCNDTHPCGCLSFFVLLVFTHFYVSVFLFFSKVFGNAKRVLKPAYAAAAGMCAAAQTDLYAVLGAHPSDSVQQLRRRYQQLALQVKVAAPLFVFFKKFCISEHTR